MSLPIGPQVTASTVVGATLLPATAPAWATTAEPTAPRFAPERVLAVRQNFADSATAQNAVNAGRSVGRSVGVSHEFIHSSFRQTDRQTADDE